MSSPAAARAARAAGSSQPVAAMQIRVGAVAQLGVGDAHRRHQVAERAPAAHHQRGRERVEHDLLRRAGLEPGRAGDHLGPDRAPRPRGRPAPASSVPVAQTIAAVSAPAARGSLERAERVGRAAARRDRDHDVVGARVRARARRPRRRRRRPPPRPRRASRAGARRPRRARHRAVGGASTSGPAPSRRRTRASRPSPRPRRRCRPPAASRSAAASTSAAIAGSAASARRRGRRRGRRRRRARPPRSGAGRGRRARRRAPPSRARRSRVSSPHVGGRLAAHERDQVAEREVGVDEVQAPARAAPPSARARRGPAPPAARSRRPRPRSARCRRPGSAAMSPTRAGTGKPSAAIRAAIPVPGANGAAREDRVDRRLAPGERRRVRAEHLQRRVQGAAPRGVGGDRGVVGGERDDAPGLRRARQARTWRKSPPASRPARDRDVPAEQERGHQAAAQLRGAARSPPRAGRAGGTCPASGRSGRRRGRGCGASGSRARPSGRRGRRASSPPASPW